MGRASRGISLLLVLALLLVLPACGESSPEGLKESDELVLYLTMGDSDFEAAIEIFEDTYPDVEVTVEEIGFEEYGDQLSAALMAGEGPDVIRATWSTFPDIYKVMDSGKFLDLTALMEADEETDWSDFIGPVLDAGKYKEKQYVIPYLYYSPTLLLSEKNMLESLGLGGLAEQKDFTSFWNTLFDALPKLRESPNYNALIGTFRSQDFFQTAGVNFLDREAGTVLPDEESVKKLTDVYKRAVYEEKAIPTTEEFGEQYMYMGDKRVAEAVTNVECAGISYAGVQPRGYFEQMANLIKTTGELVSIPFPSVTGGSYAQVSNVIGINGSSKNQLNAWNFIKIYMSPEIQEMSGGTTTRKSTQRAATDERGDKLGSHSVDITGQLVTFSDEEVDAFYAQIQDVERAGMADNYVWEIYEECMEPYFKDTDSYENCLEQLRSRLTVYMSE